MKFLLFTGLILSNYTTINAVKDTIITTPEAVDIVFTPELQDNVVAALKECVICISPLELSDVVEKLSCDHEFHSDCIKPWLKINSTCPTCRQRQEPPQKNYNELTQDELVQVIMDTIIPVAKKLIPFLAMGQALLKVHAGEIAEQQIIAAGSVYTILTIGQVALYQSNNTDRATAGLVTLLIAFSASLASEAKTTQLIAQSIPAIITVIVIFTLIKTLISKVPTQEFRFAIPAFVLTAGITSLTATLFANELVTMENTAEKSAIATVAIFSIARLSEKIALAVLPQQLQARA